jgi:indolepyruvate ferredoxin oxidoreductase alpha subunit
MAVMKHVGLNVALDPVMAINQTGVKGGLVIVVADDPSCHSSQNEQDSRYLAKFSELPMLQPTTIQEAKDFTIQAFKISEETELPVFIRTVTRLSHSRGDLILGKIQSEKRIPNFEKGRRWGMFAGVSRFRHQWRHDRDDFVTETTHKPNLNQLLIPKGAKPLKIGSPFPPPTDLLKKLLTQVDTVLIAEEVEPYLEEWAIQTAYYLKNEPKIYGKLSEHIPRYWELNVEIILKAIRKILKISKPLVPDKHKQLLEKAKTLPVKRPLTMCIGCPHRATFYALRKVLRKVAKGKAIITGDIGCYALGWTPPWEMQDTILCMGASIGIGQGMVQAGTDVPVIATIGDSTTLHSGLPSLISANYNKAKLVILIMDNSVTAMTGFQPHPGTGVTATGASTVSLDLENLVKATNVDFLRVIDPYDTEETIRTLEEAVQHENTAVVIARRACALIAERDRKRAGLPRETYYVDPKACLFCMTCLKQVNCPAISIRNEKSFIDPLQCIGCGLCAHACAFNAIKKREGSQ